RGGDDRGVAGDPDHRGVVAVVEPHHQIVEADRAGEVGDDALQLTRRNLAGASATVGVLGESHHFSVMPGTEGVSVPRRRAGGPTWTRLAVCRSGSVFAQLSRG